MDLSSNAKVLYALLFDRAGISKEKLRRSRQITTRAFQELARNGLIVRKKQGLSRPAVIILRVPPGKEA